MKPWQLGDGDNTVSTEQLRMEFIFDSINRQLAAIGVTNQTTFDVFANYIGYSTGGTPSYQDMQVAWTPTNLKLGEQVGFIVDGGTFTNFVFLGQTSLGGFSLTGGDLTSFVADALVSIDPSATQFGGINLNNNLSLTNFSALLLATVGGSILLDNTGITTISLPSLASVGGDFESIGSGVLTSVITPSLITVTGDISLYFNTALTTVDFSALVPTNGKSINFVGCALNATSVNQILARCVANAGFVSGLVDLHGGTSDAPTGQGIVDKATLNARLAGLAVTN